MMKLFKKFNLQHGKIQNEITDENDEVEEDNNETDESHEDDMSDLEILGVSRSDHPCYDEALVEKQTCGLRNKPCEYEIFGIPRKPSAPLEP